MSTFEVILYGVMIPFVLPVGTVVGVILGIRAFFKSRARVAVQAQKDLEKAEAVAKAAAKLESVSKVLRRQLADAMDDNCVVAEKRAILSFVNAKVREYPELEDTFLGQIADLTRKIAVASAPKGARSDKSQS